MASPESPNVPAWSRADSIGYTTWQRLSYPGIAQVPAALPVIKGRLALHDRYQAFVDSLSVPLAPAGGGPAADSAADLRVFRRAAAARTATWQRDSSAPTASRTVFLAAQPANASQPVLAARVSSTTSDNDAYVGAVGAPPPVVAPINPIAPIGSTLAALRAGTLVRAVAFPASRQTDKRQTGTDSVGARAAAQSGAERSAADGPGAAPAGRAEAVGVAPVQWQHTSPPNEPAAESAAISSATTPIARDIAPLASGGSAPDFVAPTAWPASAKELPLAFASSTQIYTAAIHASASGGWIGNHVDPRSTHSGRPSVTLQMAVEGSDGHFSPQRRTVESVARHLLRPLSATALGAAMPLLSRSVRHPDVDGNAAAWDATPQTLSCARASVPAPESAGAVEAAPDPTAALPTPPLATAALTPLEPHALGNVAHRLVLHPVPVSSTSPVDPGPLLPDVERPHATAATIAPPVTATAVAMPASPTMILRPAAWSSHQAGAHARDGAGLAVTPSLAFSTTSLSTLPASAVWPLHGAARRALSRLGGALAQASPAAPLTLLPLAHTSIRMGATSIVTGTSGASAAALLHLKQTGLDTVPSSSVPASVHPASSPSAFPVTHQVDAPSFSGSATSAMRSAIQTAAAVQALLVEHPAAQPPQMPLSRLARPASQARSLSDDCPIAPQSHRAPLAAEPTTPVQLSTTAFARAMAAGTAQLLAPTRFDGAGSAAAGSAVSESNVSRPGPVGVVQRDGPIRFAPAAGVRAPAAAGLTTSLHRPGAAPLLLERSAAQPDAGGATDRIDLTLALHRRSPDRAYKTLALSDPVAMAARQADASAGTAEPAERDEAADRPTVAMAAEALPLARSAQTARCAGAAATMAPTGGESVGSMAIVAPFSSTSATSGQRSIGVHVEPDLANEPAQSGAMNAGRSMLYRMPAAARQADQQATWTKVRAERSASDAAAFRMAPILALDKDAPRDVAMPLAWLRSAVADGGGASAALDRAASGSSAVASSPAAQTLLDPVAQTAGGSTVRHPDASAVAVRAPEVDIDDLVERAWRAMMSRLATERERRGFGRWA